MSDNQSDDLDALAQAADSAASDDVKLRHTCPSCGSSRSKYGVLGTHRHTFIPEGKTMALGYRARATVCLDCGYLRHFLGADDVRKIRDDK